MRRTLTTIALTTLVLFGMSSPASARTVGDSAPKWQPKAVVIKRCHTKPVTTTAGKWTPKSIRICRVTRRVFAG